MWIELKTETIVIIVTTGIMLTIGVITGWVTFMVLPAILIPAVLIDLALACRTGLQLNAKAGRSLSKELLPLGSTVDTSTELNYSGWWPRKMRIHQPLNSSAKLMNTLEEDIVLQRGKRIKITATIKPLKKGEMIIEPMDAKISSVFFYCYNTLGEPLRLPVYPILGLYARHDMINDDKKELFNSFNKDNKLDKDRADTRAVCFILDVSPSMDTGGAITELDTAINCITSIVNRVIDENESTSMVYFTKNDIVGTIPPGTGSEHAIHFSRRLYEIKPEVDDIATSPPSFRTIKEIDNLFEYLSSIGVEPAVKVLQETCGELVSTIENSGFIKAVYQACQYADQGGNIVILTNLSMGMPCLLEGINVIHFYGYSATIVLVPHLWYDDEALADTERFYEKYRDIKDAESKIRSLNVKIVVPGKKDYIEDLIFHDTSIVNMTDARG